MQTHFPLWLGHCSGDLLALALTQACVPIPFSVQRASRRGLSDKLTILWISNLLD